MSPLIVVQNRLQVESAAGFTPLSIPNLFGWWNPANAGSIHATGDEVDTYDDLSGNGHTLAQSGGSRPHTGNNTLNGLNVLNMSSEFFQPQSSWTLNQPLTIYAVTNCVTNVTQRYFDAFDNSVSCRRNITTAKGQVQAGSTLTTPGNEWTINTWFVVRWVINGASSKVRVGASEGTGNAGTNNMSGTNIVVGGGADGPILLADFVVVNASISSGDDTSLMAYFLAKWGV